LYTVYLLYHKARVFARGCIQTGKTLNENPVKPLSLTGFSLNTAQKLAAF